MKFIFKNISPDTIELYDLGFTMDPGQVTEVRTDIDTSDDLAGYISSGDIVFLSTDLVEASQAESAAILAKQTLVEHEKVYSKEEVDQLLADLVNSSPGVLDTLNELALALGNDPDFATTITAQIDGKAPLVHDHALTYAALLHNHDSQYYNISTIDAFLANKASSTHLHPEYAASAHDHNSLYSPITHDHAGVYATLADLGAITEQIFGSNFAYAQQSAVLTMTSKVPMDYITLSVNVAQDGLYRLATSYKWAHDDISTDFEAHIIHQNGAIYNEIYTHKEEAADSGGTNGNIGTDQKLPAAWFTYMPLIAGTHVFRLSINGSSNNVKASIWNANLEFWRVQ